MLIERDKEVLERREVTRYISLADTSGSRNRSRGVNAATLINAARVDLVDKAAVLTCRLAWNRPLPDGNKRAVWAALAMFIDLNDGSWDPDPPDVDDTEAAMVAVAAHDVDEQWLARRLDGRVHFDQEH